MPELKQNSPETELAEEKLNEVRNKLEEWENQKEPVPERSEAVICNRQRLDENIDQMLMERHLNKKARRFIDI